MALKETLVLDDRVSGPLEGMRRRAKQTSTEFDKLKTKGDAFGKAASKAEKEMAREHEKAVKAASKAAAQVQRQQQKAMRQQLQQKQQFKKFQSDEALGGLFGGGASATGILAAGAAVGVMVGLLAKAAGAALDLAGGFAQGVIEAHLARDQAKSLMDTLSGGHGAEVLDRLKTQAIAFGDSVEALQKNVVAARDAGLSWKEAFKLNAIRADMEATGRSTEYIDTAIGNMLDEVKKGKDASQAMSELAKAQGVVGDGAARVAQQQATLGGALTRLKNVGTYTFDAIAAKAGPQLDKLGTKITGMLDDFVNSGDAQAMVDKLSDAVERVSDAVGVALQLVRPFWDAFKTAIGPSIDNIKLVGDAISKAFGGDSATQMSKLSSIAKGFGSILGFVVGQAVTAAAGLAILAAAGAALIGWLGNLAQKAYDAGASLITGLVNGIRNGISQAVAAAQELANRVKGAIGSVLQMHSPSKVMEKYGKVGVSGGFAGGIKKGEGAVEDAAGSMARAAPSGAVAGAAAAGGPGGGPRVNIGDVTFVINAPNAQNAGELKAVMRDEIRSWFEAALLEQGV